MCLGVCEEGGCRGKPTITGSASPFIQIFGDFLRADSGAFPPLHVDFLKEQIRRFLFVLKVSLFIFQVLNLPLLYFFHLDEYEPHYPACTRVVFLVKSCKTSVYCLNKRRSSTRVPQLLLFLHRQSMNGLFREGVLVFFFLFLLPILFLCFEKGGRKSAVESE